MQNKGINIIFFGTPNFAAFVLQKLIDYQTSPDKRIAYEISAVITAPDAPFGRKSILTPSPIKVLALTNNILILTPQKLDDNFVQILNSKFQILNSIFLLAAYNKIIPPSLLALPKHGFLNIHPSFLPQFRGPSPIQSAIISGQTHTGVSIIKLDQEIDHGDLIAQQGVTIEENENTQELGKKLFEKGTDLFLQILPEYLKGHISGISQNHAKATYTKKISTQNGFIKLETLKKALAGENITQTDLPEIIREIDNGSSSTFNPPSSTTIFHPLPSIVNTSITIHNFIRALSPEPGAWTLILSSDSLKQPKRLKLLKSRLENNRLVLDLVQLEGKNPVTFKQFHSSHPTIFS